jgi:hypothetical protein
MLDTAVTKLVDTLLSQGPLVCVLLLILVTGWKRVWVWGREADSCQKREDEWKEMAMRNMGIADRTLSIAERKP